MQHLPEDRPRKGREFDETPTKEEAETKRQKLVMAETVRPKASVPSWLQYDSNQVYLFGTPHKHEQKFSKLFSPQTYASKWLPCFIHCTHTLTSRTLIYEHITMSISFDSDYKKGTSVLTLSDLIFDRFSVQHRVYELIFWSLIWECFCRNIQMFVILNPWPIVREAFVSLSYENFFDFKINPNMDLELDIEHMKRLLLNIPREIRESGCMKIIKSPLTVITTLRPILRPHDGSAISNNYLHNLECLLSRILVTPKGYGDADYATEVACIFVNFGVRKIQLDCFEVRPCFQGLGCGRIILHVLMHYCIVNEIASFEVIYALEPTKHLCRSLGFQESPLMFRDYIITLDEMKKRALPEQCGLPPGLLRRDETYPGLFRLDSARFPTADQLNDQAAVDARRAHA